MILVALASVVLHGGQTRYFLPGAVPAGENVRCIAYGHELDANVPARTSSVDYWTKGGPTFQIDRRDNGAIEIVCGRSAPAGPPTSPMPYVIGPNGLALIRGANTLTKLEQVYGKPSDTKPCRAAWKDIGLEVTFSGRSCNVLDGAAVTGSRWRSINGVHVGDSIAKAVWLTQTRSHPALGHVWVIGRGTQYRSTLVAWVGSKGIIERLSANLQRPPE